MAVVVKIRDGYCRSIVVRSVAVAEDDSRAYSSRPVEVVEWMIGRVDGVGDARSVMYQLSFVWNRCRCSKFPVRQSCDLRIISFIMMLAIDSD